MGRLLWKELLRTIRRTFGQFLAIAAIVALGCGFFAGIQATTPNMNEMADAHYQETNLMDLQILSAIGLDAQDVEAVSKLEDVKDYYAGYRMDCYLSKDANHYTMRTYSMPMAEAAQQNTMNLPQLTEGSYPIETDQCLMDARFAEKYGYQVGDTIVLEAAEDVVLSDALNHDTYTITGLVNWSMYISGERGTSQIGTGALNGYLLLDDAAFCMPVYSSLYVTLHSTDGIEAYAAAYTEAAEVAALQMERESVPILQARIERETADARAELADARKDLEDQQAEYAAAFAQLAEAYGEEAAAQQLADSEKQLKNAEEMLAEQEQALDDFAKQAEWYVQTREDNVGYADFWENTERVANIVKVFPLFFILIAALICLTTMTRMVKEQRVELGTRKALGYGAASIMAKYLLYAAGATLLGSVSGLLVGYQVFPRVICNAYASMYYLQDIPCPFRWETAMPCIVIALLCTCVSSAIACRNALKAQPAQLMRPKPPKSGKRILLERIPFLWKHIRFMSKLTLRNVFRYKSRFWMTTIGVGGCTALILAGFGMRHAITSIADLQYDAIMHYDLMAVYLEDEAHTRTEVLSEEEDNPHTVLMQQAEEAGAYSVSLMVTESSEALNEFITLRQRTDHTACSIREHGVVITEKIAQLLNLSVGDTISLKDAKMPLEVTGITENYSYHYIYMTAAQYETAYEKEAVPNTMLIRLEDRSTADAHAAELMQEDGMLMVQSMQDSGNIFEDLIDSMNMIVMVLIVCAGALAFVVLYNLSNINITERTRELATVKVLGFYDSESASYIYRENLFSMAAGIVLGLISGVFLTRFVVAMAEVDVVMFSRDIPLYAFVLAAGMTVVFTLLVNAILYPKINRIDMATALKAVE